MRFSPVDRETLRAARRDAARLAPGEVVTGRILCAYAAAWFAAIRALGDIDTPAMGGGFGLALVLLASLRTRHRLVAGLAAALVGGAGPWRLWGLFALPLLAYPAVLLWRLRGDQERNLRAAREVGGDDRSPSRD